jgi:hypothetical protein
MTDFKDYDDYVWIAGVLATELLRGRETQCLGLMSDGDPCILCLARHAHRFSARAMIARCSDQPLLGAIAVWFGAAARLEAPCLDAKHEAAP